MTENKINEIIQTSLEKIKELSGTGTIVGEKIETNSGVTIIPISKVSLGFASGGIDIGAKTKNDGKTNGSSYGGGGGTGVSIIPVAFLTISASGDVDIVNVSASSNSSPISAVGDIIEKTPEILRKFKAVFSKDGEKKADDIFAHDDDLK